MRKCRGAVMLTKMAHPMTITVGGETLVGAGAAVSWPWICGMS